MAQKTIRINGTNFTSYVPRAGYSVGYNKVDGSAGGVMLDGSTTVDVLAIKAVVTVPLMPLTQTQANTLISSILSTDYPTLYYFDPRANTYRTIATIVDAPPSRHAGTNINNDEIWKLDALTFTER